jgi:hypothetical protein
MIASIQLSRIIGDATDTGGFRVFRRNPSRASYPQLNSFSVVEVPCLNGRTRSVSVARCMAKRPVGTGLVLSGQERKAMYSNDKPLLDYLKEQPYYSPAHTIWFVYDEQYDCLQPMLDDGCIVCEDEWAELHELVSKFYHLAADKNIEAHNEARKKFFAKQERPTQKQLPERRKVSGFVYLIQSELNHYKIGKAQKIEQRMSAFSLTLPFAIELIHSFKSNDYSRAEAVLHQRFALKRGRGEWFNLEPEDVAWICSLTDGSLDEELGE